MRLRGPIAPTESKDRRIKMPLYVRYGVSLAWPVDPMARTLVACLQEAEDRREIGCFSSAYRVCLPRFEALRLDL